MKDQHETFIREYIRTGNRIEAYKIAYPDAQGQALRTAAARLHHKPHIQQRINAIMQPLREKAIADLETCAAERIKQELCTLQRRREQLAKIIMGGWQVKRHIKIKDSIIEVYDDVPVGAIIRAIDLDSKLAANKYREKTAEEKKEPAYAPYINPAFVPPAPKTDLPFTPNPKGSIPGEPEYEYWFQKDVEEFMRDNPHLPPDYLTNPVYMDWKHNHEETEETVTNDEQENAVTICNQNTAVMPEPDTLTIQAPDLWLRYSKLEPHFRLLTAEQLRHRETTFRSMKPAAQQSLLRPLMQSLENEKAYKQGVRKAS